MEPEIGDIIDINWTRGVITRKEGDKFVLTVTEPENVEYYVWRSTLCLIDEEKQIWKLDFNKVYGGKS